MGKIDITPKTKVLQLIETYPFLEEALIRFVPAFIKLKNPFLRKTIARVATLQQAARVGNVGVEELVNMLRKEAGLSPLHGEETLSGSDGCPPWFDKALIAGFLDLRPMLEAGEQPITRILRDLKHLPSGKIYHITAPFVPAPLIDQASGMKYSHCIQREEENLVHVFFIRTEAAGSNPAG